MSGSAFITRVVLENYKSIAACDISLGPLTFFVGPNGSGKSNFLDALSFVADALLHSPAEALQRRGGPREVCRRREGTPTAFGIRLEFVLPDGATGHYAFSIQPLARGQFEVAREEYRFNFPGKLRPHHTKITVRDGQETTHSTYPEVMSLGPFKMRKHYQGLRLERALEHLFLPVGKRSEKIDGLDGVTVGLGMENPGFAPAYYRLCAMSFYNLSPAQIRGPKKPEADQILASDGHNLASVLARLSERAAPVKRRIEEYLAQVVPGLVQVNHKLLGPYETVEFRQRASGGAGDMVFLADNMSDGTLRALGVLLALFQTQDDGNRPVSLVGIEEPELALHPAAAAILLDGLREASAHRQILVTSHSPDLLDDKRIATESIIAATAEDGLTRLGPLDETGRAALRDHLYTAGELLRMNQLAPAHLPDAVPPRIFDDETP